MQDRTPPSVDLDANRRDDLEATEPVAVGEREDLETDGQPVDLAIHASRVQLDGAERPATVLVRDGRIVAVHTGPWSGPARQVATLAADEVLVPGLVDTHVHVNEPGRTEWEGFDTATAAAAAAGITTLIDMPLNSLPPTLDAAALERKRDAARDRCRVDVGFWGGAVPGNTDDLPDLFAAGVFGVKCFLQDSGVPEFPPVSPADLRRTARIVAALDGLLLVHAEDPAVLGSAPAPRGRSYPAFVDSRPAGAEAAAVAEVVRASRETGCRVHVVHLSSAAGARVVRSAKADGVRITAETCPHYLVLAAEDIPDGAPQYKCCPPVRGRADQEALWDALLDGTVDIVVSDHSPSTPELKQLDAGDLGLAWGGIAGLQFGAAAVRTAAQDRGIDLATVLRWTARGPADLAGLRHKGRIEVGTDADLVALADRERWTVTTGDIRHRHPVTPYLGRTLSGVVRRCWLRGTELTRDRPAGRLLRAGDR
ncbi:allantoinase AllB [Nakamurella endophytica]|uniref:allantoinase n=1 Tax=Nakamurella endophytica TaxID=1748367 RepID=A0A917WKX3_9ACTN|nr:allantoinase AllB [Nakamurella endophytica]GGM11098.1 allantoinase [Nakamurella endophytica]